MFDPYSVFFVSKGNLNDVYFIMVAFDTWTLSQNIADQWQQEEEQINFDIHDTSYDPKKSNPEQQIPSSPRSIFPNDMITVLDRIL